jgi:hypothetical protein
MSKFYKKPTFWVVVAFVLGMSFAFIEEANAHATTDRSHSATVGVYTGVVNSNGVRTQRLSYRYQDRWEVSYARVGGKGWSTANYFSVSRLVFWRGNDRGPFLSLGAAYTDGLVGKKDEGKPLVTEQLTYELGIGYQWVLSSATDMELRWIHNSTAGRSERNKGIDRVGLTYNWRF